jgi:HSP20 family molecular chaperone IbpA
MPVLTPINPRTSTHTRPPARSVRPAHNLNPVNEKAPSPQPLSAASALFSYVPPIDVVERDGVIRIIAEIPGLSEKNVRITVTPALLRLSGEKPGDMTEENPLSYRMERRSGRFQREVALPAEVDINKVVARMHNGLLEITLHKSTHSRTPSRKISIKHD